MYRVIYLPLYLFHVVYARKTTHNGCGRATGIHCFAARNSATCRYYSLVSLVVFKFINICKKTLLHFFVHGHML